VKKEFMVIVCILSTIVVMGMANVNHVPDMVTVKGGTFRMGDEHGDLRDGARPVHTVTLTYDYYIGQYELTNAEFLEFLNDAGVSSTGYLNGCEVLDVDSVFCAFKYSSGTFRLYQAGKADHPVINVNWYHAASYCNWLSDREGLARAYDSTGNLIDKNGRETTDITKVEGYRLPTEAEWEYAARGGHKSTGDYKYAGSNDIDTVAWDWYSLDHKAHGVGQKAPNELGLYDMSGNVWEWCQDWYDEDYYDKSPRENPVNLNSASGRVVRGGTWANYVWDCRVAIRYDIWPDSDFDLVGLRIARTRK